MTARRAAHATSDPDPVAPAPTRVRKDPVARRAELVGVARGVFAEVGYADSGLAEIASAASVSKGLLYHYFPDGRPQLFVSVTEEVLSELRDRLHRAAKVPFSARRRMERLLAELFACFTEQPDTFRLLFREGWASHEPLIEAAAVAARVQVAGDIAALMAGTDHPAEEIVSASAGVLGFAIANVELCLAGTLDAETARRVTTAYATSRLPR